MAKVATLHVPSAVAWTGGSSGQSGWPVVAPSAVKLGAALRVREAATRPATDLPQPLVNADAVLSAIVNAARLLMGSGLLTR